ncbi:MAG: VCBS repeat-containing protein [Candidatus Eisenbacteria bacterium]|uniref:VCBS repeat-containing protein n=1 Tax=Eiseniibacteriota bacterium TaxID=2212470 RepID=A0A933W902_UNCEI|nr:VCBS repeat-containing protein [Candidatus Eisenbacteria bacterium]
MRAPLHRREARERGFSLIEMIVTLSIMAMVVAALSTVLIRATASRLASANRFESLQTARSAADMMARDLRSAGYGVDATNAAGAQPAIAYVDSMQIFMCENATPYPDNGSPAAPQAYDPSGSPTPRVLVGTEWTPPTKYATGAEMIRYTLDLNDDGRVDADDVAADEGADARRSRCPDDYTLVRQVYGAGSGGAYDNGGAAERIALVLKPGEGVPALFTVYFDGSETPWDWSRGAVPAARLSQISRIEITVTAASGKPDTRGQYPRTRIETAVRSLRNTPDFGASAWTVDGYVYTDEDFDRVKDSNERGLSGALVRLGSGRATYTNASGYYSFRVPTGTYALRHVAPAGFGSYSVPDSFTVDVAGNVTRSFADTSRTGGWITASVWSDDDADGYWDTGESALSGVTMSAGSGAQNLTDSRGRADLFVTAGPYSLSTTPLSGYSMTTANPVTGTMTIGGTRTAQFGQYRAVSTTVNGAVFTDTDGSGTWNGIETGRSGVTVTAYIGTSTLYSTTRTDAAGKYTFSLPTPAVGSGTTYSIGCAQVAGCYPTTTLLHTGLVLTGTALSGYNFGFGTFASASFSGYPATALIATDLWENDAGGTAPNTKGDQDLVYVATVLGVPYLNYVTNGWTAGGTPFSSTSTVAAYLGTTPYSVFADTLRRGSTPRAVDLVPGLTGSNNIELWLRTGTSIPTTYLRRLGTGDGGRVLQVRALDCSGGTQIDLIVGTRTTSGRGTVEIWQSDDATSPGYGRQETYPSAASIPGSRMGEAQQISLADMDRDGDKDMVIATSTGTYSGEVIVLDNIGRTNGSRFRYRNMFTLSTDNPKQMALTDVDGDGYPDIVLGTKTSTTAGRILVYRNTHSTSTWTYSLSQSFSAPGCVLSMAVADLGGSASADVAVGYVTNTSTGAGGVRIFYNVGGSISTSSVDPSGGAVTKQVVAMTTGNFNYTSSPATAGPYKTDLAICWKSSTTVGYFVVYTR